MGKKFNEWLDEFVEQGADATDITNWPQEAGGGGLVHHKVTVHCGEECGTNFNGIMDIYCDKTDLFDLDSFIDYNPKTSDLTPSEEGIVWIVDIGGTTWSIYPFAIYNGYYKNGSDEGLKISYCNDAAKLFDNPLTVALIGKDYCSVSDEIVND